MNARPFRPWRRLAAWLPWFAALAWTPAHARMNPLDLTVRTVTVTVQRADGTPVPDAIVRLVSDDWNWRTPRDEWDWARTDAQGQVTMPLTQGRWSAVAAGDLVFSNAHPGHALYMVQPFEVSAASTNVTLRSDRTSMVQVRRPDGTPLAVEELRAVLDWQRPGWVSAACGWSGDGTLVLETSDATGHIALAAVHRADPGDDAWLLEGVVQAGEPLVLAPAAAALATFRFESFDMNGVPANGNVEVRPPDFDANNFLWDFGTAPTRVFHTNAPVVKLNYRFLDYAGEYFYLDGDVCDAYPGLDTTIAFGGQLNSFVHVIPRNNPEFGERTQVWLQVSDAHGHDLLWPPTREPVRFRTYVDGVPATYDEFDRYAFSVPAWFPVDSTTTFSAAVPAGGFGTMELSGRLFEPWTLYATSRIQTPQFAVFAPGQFDARTSRVVDFLQGYRDMLEYLSPGEMPAPVQYVIDVDGSGMPGEVVPLKVPLSVQRDVDPRVPRTLFFVGHEMGHVRLLHPDGERTLQVPYQEYGESYASLLCLVGFEPLVATSLIESEWGSHDLVFRHLTQGTPVQDVWDATECLQWIERVLYTRYGWELHRSLMYGYQVELAGLRARLLEAGFSDWEAIPVLYSRLAGDNLGWLWELGALGVTTPRVQAGLDLIASMDVPGAVATRAELAPPAPSPSAGPVTLRFALARAGDVRLEVYDVAGRLVATPCAAPLDAGPHAIGWDLREAGGARARPGLYFCRLVADGHVSRRKLVVSR
ncbi:MAG: hypothetical protein U0704_13130 [Candidatus Eisenbacteria bacterium]